MYEQLLLHLFGDFIVQNEWMAKNKRSDIYASISFSVLYTVPFLLITRSVIALSIIFISHALIDRLDISKPLNKFKNNIYNTDSGLQKDRPDYFTVWLLMWQDTSLHLIVNYLAIKYF